MYHNRKIMGGLFTWAIRLLPVAILLACATAFGAQGETAAPVPDVPMGNMVVDPNQAQLEGDLIKFIAFQKESNIRDGLRLLAALCKKNIVPSAGVDGPLTVSRLYNVTFEEALKAVLGYGFRYDLDGDFVRVYTAAEYKTIKEDPERMTHKVIPLYYITAEEAKNLITPVLSDAHRIQVSSPAQKEISSGSGGGSGGSGGSLTSSGGGDDPGINDTIVLYDYPENIADAMTVISQVDTRPVQVLVEATIMSAILTEGMELGVDLNFMAGASLNGESATETIVAGDNISRGEEATSPIEEIMSVVGTPLQTYGFATQGGPGLRIGVGSGNFRAFLSALESTTDVTVLANTKILAVNKQEGSVLIGTNLGYRSSTTIGQGGVATSGEVEFLQTGTQLVFRPYVGNDGYIRMDIYPKDSDASLNEDRVPTEKTTELKTNVIVRDGQTIVIGGLFRDVIVTGRQQVPVLGSLPVVGALFRSTTDSMQREEVIIMLTPHIIEEPSETDGDARAEDVRRKREGAIKNLMAIDRTRLAEDSYARAARFYLEGDVDSAMFHVKIALMMRPSYLEARRLYERMVAETDPEELKRIDSIVNQAIEQQEAGNWQRH